MTQYQLGHAGIGIQNIIHTTNRWVFGYARSDENSFFYTSYFIRLSQELSERLEEYKKYIWEMERMSESWEHAAVTSPKEPKLTIVESEGMGHIGSEIQITGYKQGTENELLDYLQRYGKIVKHETINGKLVVQFEEPSSAIAALKSDGFVCQGQKILVKLHDVTTNEPSDNDNDEQGRLPPSKRLEIPTNLYKSTNKLGSGQHGITALDRNTCIRPTDRPKEVSFYTRILELVLGW
ncbi:hypothetical protein K501DRAFT_277595 [Backusella circina FSU 941]|nr:hypothetical protein K501DRAFT_277595 [Backusella circina FSU 941]